MRHFQWLVLLVTGAVAIGAPAQSQPTQPPQILAFQVQVHFPPPNERKPVPFELVHNHLLFRARVEGHDVWAILDNGAQYTLIDRAFAQSSGLKIGPQNGTATGGLESRLLTGVRIEIPGQVDLRPPVEAVDLSAVSKLLGRPISLVAGKDLFDFLAFFVSGTNRNFILAPSGTLRVTPGTPEIDLKDGEPQLDITIAGKPALVKVDLGSDATVGLSNAAWSRLGLNGLATTEGKSTGADGRVVTTKHANVETASIGPIQTRNVTVIVGPTFPGNGDGVLGMGFFSDFDFLIDVKARKIWLSPVARAPIGGAAKK